jgi:hypothetical protein
MIFLTKLCCTDPWQWMMISYGGTSILPGPKILKLDCSVSKNLARGHGTTHL